MSIKQLYTKNWCIKRSITKTMSPVFHLNNRHVSRKLNVMENNKF